jgi:hypothetical protein
MSIGSSHTSGWRRRKAGRLSVDFKKGDRDAAWRLKQRYRAILGLQSGMPWQERLALANEARARNLERRRREEAEAALEKRELNPFLLSSRDPSD